jgi:hypothetical protein
MPTQHVPAADEADEPAFVDDWQPSLVMGEEEVGE